MVRGLHLQPKEATMLSCGDWFTLSEMRTWQDAMAMCLRDTLFSCYFVILFHSMTDACCLDLKIWCIHEYIIQYEKYSTCDINILNCIINIYRLPVKCRVQFKILMHTYNSLHEQSPRYISDILTVYQPIRTLRSMGSVTLVVPRVRTSSYSERKFQCSAAKLWNVLPAHIPESKTLNIFKMLLKTPFWSLISFLFLFLSQFYII